MPYGKRSFICSQPCQMQGYGRFPKRARHFRSVILRAPKPEVKAYTKQIDHLFNLTSDNYLSPIANGSERSERIGRKVMMRYLTLQLWNTTDDWQQIRVIIYVPKVAGATMAIFGLSTPPRRATQ